MIVDSKNGHWAKPVEAKPVRDDLDRATGRKARRGKIGIAEFPAFVTSSGMHAIAWSVPNVTSFSSGGPAVVLVSLPRVPSLERPMLT